MELKSNKEVVERLVAKFENNLKALISYRSSFIIYPLSEGIYSVNYCSRKLTFNVDINFNTGGDLPYLYIVKFAVSPTGKGIGTLLMGGFLQLLKEEEGFDRVYLRSTNEASTRFWKRIGFQDIPMDSEDSVYKANIPRPNMVYRIPYGR